MLWLSLKDGRSSKFNVKLPYSPQTDGVGEATLVVLVMEVALAEAVVGMYEETLPAVESDDAALLVDAALAGVVLSKLLVEYDD